MLFNSLRLLKIQAAHHAMSVAFNDSNMP